MSQGVLNQIKIQMQMIILRINIDIIMGINMIDSVFGVLAIDIKIFFVN